MPNPGVGAKMGFVQRTQKIEGDLVSGELVGASHTPLVPLLTAFCEHLSTIRTRKSYKNDLSYLRTFFGPVCDGLVLGTPVNRGCHPKLCLPNTPSALQHKDLRVSPLIARSATISPHITRTERPRWAS